MKLLTDTFIHIKVRDTYQRRFYPDCPIAQIFADIAGTTTRTDVVLKQIEKVGYKISYTMDGDLPTTNSREM